MKSAKKGAQDGAIELSFDPKVYHEDAVLGAAHVFASRAQVWVDGHRVTLEPKNPPEKSGSLDLLAQEFLEETTAQELRRRIATLNRPVREYIVTRALLSVLDRSEAAGGAQPPLPILSQEQEREIAALIQDAEAEIREREQKRLGLSDASKS